MSSSGHASVKDQSKSKHFGIAQLDNVPEHLVGKAYKEFTPADHAATRKWRVARGACEGCGIFGHAWKDCRRLGSKYRYRRDNSLCLDCASPKHEWETCPRRKQLERLVGPRAKEGEVPRWYIGTCYSVLDGAARAQIRKYRVRKYLCWYCAAEDHDQFNCPRRLARTQMQYKQSQKEAVTRASTNKACLLLELPAELQLKIWEFVTCRASEIAVQPGFYLKGLFMAGLPFKELFQAFIRTNTFKFRNLRNGARLSFATYISQPRALVQFERALSQHDAFNHVRCLHFFIYELYPGDISSWGSQGGRYFDFSGYLKLLKLCRCCTKLKLSVRGEFISICEGTWAFDDHSVPQLIEESNFEAFADVKHLRSITFDSHGLPHPRAINAQGGMAMLVKAVTKILVNAGREDIDVDYLEASSESSGRDNEEVQ